MVCVCELEFLECGVCVNWRVSGVCGGCVCVCVCVSSALGEERTGGSLIEDGMCAETLDFLCEISCTGISK